MINSSTIVTRDRFQLQVKQYRVWLHVGCTEQERKNEQPIDISILISLSEPPLATDTDNLSDTFCYATLLATLREQVESRPFNLLEHLAATLGHAAKTFLQEKTPVDTHNMSISVGVTKVAPPMVGILGGVSVVVTV